MENNLGRLVRSLSERCSNCSHPLQLRAREIPTLVRGEMISEEEQYKVCNFCGEEFEIPLRDRKTRVVRVDKTAYIPEVIEDKKRRPNNASNKKSGGTSTSNGRPSGKGTKRNY